MLLSGSFNLAEIVIAKHKLPLWVDAFMIPMTFVFFVSILAETNRHPFDLPEAEAELVSGYNVEYSSMPFASNGANPAQAWFFFRIALVS